MISKFVSYQAPAPKKKTRWEEYSQKKGIQKRKKGRMAWDETAKEWKPRWGYKRANDDTKEWLIEVPDQAGKTYFIVISYFHP